MRIKKLLAITIIFIGSLFLFSCNGKKEVLNNKLTVSVSVLPQEFFVEKIGGDKVSINTLIPPGASPVSYEPTPRQIADLVNSKIYVKVGHPSFPFEKKWFEKIISGKKIIAVNMSAGIDYRFVEKHDYNEDHNHRAEETGISNDPHVWVSPACVKKASENILKALIEADPENSKYYTANYEVFKKEIEKIQQQIHLILQGVNKENNKFMVFHPSWGYFADEFGLQQIAIESNGKEPSAKGIASIIDQAKLNNIKVIFIQKGFNSSAAQVIAKEIKGKVVEIDPLAKNWLENLKKVAEIFKETMDK